MREIYEIDNIVILLENITQIIRKKDSEIVYSKEVTTNEEGYWNGKETR